MNETPRQRQQQHSAIAALFLVTDGTADSRTTPRSIDPTKLTSHNLHQDVSKYQYTPLFTPEPP